jgi:hypothetical protein
MPGEDFHLSVDVRLQAHGLPVHRGTVNAVHARTRLMSWPSRARQAPGPRPQASALEKGAGPFSIPEAPLQFLPK